MGAAIVVAPRSQARQSGAADHCHTLAGGTPILALDMYEHSYQMDFGAKAASYVDCFMEVVRWQNAERHFKSLTDSNAT